MRDRRTYEAALGRLTAGLWHELVNLLSVLSVWTKLDDHPDAPNRVEGALGRMTRLIHAEHLCSTGALREVRMRYTTREIAAHVLDLVEPKLRTTDRTMTLAAEKDVVLTCNPGEIVLVLTLLVWEALAAAAEPSALTLAVEPEETDGAVFRLSGVPGDALAASDASTLAGTVAGRHGGGLTLHADSVVFKIKALPT